MNLKKTILAGSAAVATVATAVIGIPLASAATTHGDGTAHTFGPGTVNVRAEANTSSAVVASLQDQQVAGIVCWTQGETAANPDGGSTDVWFKIEQGYVSGAFFFQNDTSQQIPACDEDPGDTPPPSDGGEVDTSSPEAFIASIAPGAQQSQAATGVPASVTMAQAILESGWGQSELTQEANNFFGIKCNGESEHSNGCVTKRTREVINGQEIWVDAEFRSYATPADSFTDHGAFLRDNARYANAFNFQDDPDQFIREVHQAGYATDPNYSSVVIGLMQDRNLYQYNN